MPEHHAFLHSKPVHRKDAGVAGCHQDKIRLTETVFLSGGTARTHSGRRTDEPGCPLCQILTDTGVVALVMLPSGIR
ncbi:hypothetical protein VY86_09560 [Photorhabdus thracensis]|uniref:Uncharacterized protein n=1 Tax=Photorhabdus thracensis TaxID=230089 RepID=A0A0F7LLT1_9GAMM|nr:hypothetical protein VY86_09560 [Photorhabdus thracensis]